MAGYTTPIRSPSPGSVWTNIVACRMYPGLHATHAERCIFTSGLCTLYFTCYSGSSKICKCCRYISSNLATILAFRISVMYVGSAERLHTHDNIHSSSQLADDQRWVIAFGGWLNRRSHPDRRERSTRDYGVDPRLFAQRATIPPLLSTAVALKFKR